MKSLNVSSNIFSSVRKELQRRSYSMSSAPIFRQVSSGKSFQFTGKQIIHETERNIAKSLNYLEQEYKSKKCSYI